MPDASPEIRPDTVPTLLAAVAERTPGREWLRTDEGSLSFGGAAAHVARLAETLRGEGVRPGDRVVVTASTTPPYLLCWLAVACSGAVAVGVNPRSSPAELAGLLAQTRPAAVVTERGLAALVGQATGAGPTRVLDVHDLVGDWTAAPPAGAPDPVAAVRGLDSTPASTPVAPGDVAALIPTSGTTGRSKLVMATHRAYAMAGEGFPYWMGLTADDRLMTSLPLFHVNALAYSTMGSLAAGAGLVLLPRFSASGFLEAARRHGATEFNAIGAMLEILMRQPARPDDAENPLRLCYTGPSPSRERQQQIERRFGLRIVCGYGLSESPYGLIWPHGQRPYGTLGTPRQHPRLGTVNEARVVDEHGRDVGTGEVGELLLRNPSVTPGYWDMPEETAALFADGWLRTGDLVTVDDGGTYTFVSRRKEVIRRRGENLSPAEVEEALAEHADVAEVAVVGVPSDLSEEDVKAFVVPEQGRHVDFAALHAHAASRLAAFKVPRYWELVGELPRTPTARVAKHQLSRERSPDEFDTERDG